jgi:predicted solute-binding protein
MHDLFATLAFFRVEASAINVAGAPEEHVVRQIDQIDAVSLEELFEFIAASAFFYASIATGAILVAATAQQRVVISVGGQQRAATEIAAGMVNVTSAAQSWRKT